MKQRWQAEDAPDKPESSKRRDVDAEDRSTESEGVEDPILRPDHKIFLSHSGAQKEFVEQLCKDLENRYHFPFFDRRHSSLPKGERFPELILRAARQCQMAVVVVSEEYFVSKWPMIELHAFVQARMGSNPDLKILPLFYQLSVKEFGDERRREKWFSVWEGLAKADSRINVGEWKESLKVLASFNGIQYNRASKELEAYREEIVSSICREVPQDIKWDDSHVQGRSILCKKLHHKIDQIRASKKKRFCPVGVYGVGGIGKTTICKILCDELFQDMKGNVSHVEFGSGTSKELLMKALKDLTSMYEDVIQRLDEGQCKHILLNGLSKRKVFLAIDNVWSDSKSIEEAKVYLQAHFHEESTIIVTSRSLRTLTSLGMDESHCFEMPNLEQEDAINLFLHHAAHGTKFSNYSFYDMCLIERCIAPCYFRKGKNEDGHYLPLALKALGVQLGCIGRCPSKWVEVLPEVKDFNYLQEDVNPVFSILRSSFDRLPPLQQSLFMDLIIYGPTRTWAFKNEMGLIEWLGIVHKKEVHEIESQLQHLKGRGLVEDVDIASQTVYVHDVYQEFAKFESKGNLDDSLKFERKRWVYYEDAYPTELEMMPSNRCWQNLKRICIFESQSNLGKCIHLESMQDIEWSNFSNVVVLKLQLLHMLRGDLNLQGLKSLRSLDLRGIYGLNSLDGLQDLNNLTYFKWISYKACMGMLTTIGHLPKSLEVLELDADVLLILEVFALCTNLRKVDLRRCRAKKLDFNTCKALQLVWLHEVQGLVTVSGLQNMNNLKRFMWSHGLTADHVCARILGQLPESLEVIRLDIDVLLISELFAHCMNLEEVKLERCRAEVLDFSTCKALQFVLLVEVEGLVTVSGLQNMNNLTHFIWSHGWTADHVRARILGQLPESLEVLKLDVDVLLIPEVFACCTNLREVELKRCRAEMLDFNTCKALQSVWLHEVQGPVTVSGLQNMNNLTRFRWSQELTADHVRARILGQLPESLQVLKLDVDVLLIPEVFACCTNLREVELKRCRAEMLDFSTCKALQLVWLHEVQGLVTVSGLQNMNNLRCFIWSHGLTADHVRARILGQLPESLQVLKLNVDVLLISEVFACCTNLREVELKRCRAEMLDFSTCKALQLVWLHEVQGLVTVSGLQNMNNLTRFIWSHGWTADHVRARILGQLPESLQVLNLDVDVLLIPEVFARCTNLREVELKRCRAEMLDFSTCKALQSVWLHEVEGLVTVSSLQNMKNLTCFIWKQRFIADHVRARILGQLLESLQVLKLNVDVLLIPEVFARYTNLREVELERCRAEVLDFNTCKAIQFVHLHEVEGLVTVSGLQNMNNLTRFIWSHGLTADHVRARILGQLPESLEVLKLDVDVLLKPEVFARCTNLREVELKRCRAEMLDFSTCKALQLVWLHEVQGLVTVSGLQNMNNLTRFIWSHGLTADHVCARILGQLPESLQVLKLDVDVLLIKEQFAHCTNLEEVELKRCRAEMLDFSTCKALQLVWLHEVQGLVTVSGLQNMNNLTCFIWKQRFIADHVRARILGQLPESLQDLLLDIDVLLIPEVLACCTNLREVELERCRAEVLDFSTCKALQFVLLVEVEGLVTVSGLQNMNNLTRFIWSHGLTADHVRARILGQLPESLEVLNLDVDVLLIPEVFARCTNLREVELKGCRAEMLDFSTCKALQLVWLHEVQGLVTVSGLQNMNNLTRFIWSHGWTADHVRARILGQLPESLQVLKLDVDVLLIPEVFAHCTNLREVEVRGCEAKKLDFNNCKALELVRHLNRYGCWNPRA